MQRLTCRKLVQLVWIGLGILFVLLYGCGSTPSIATHTPEGMPPSLEVDASISSIPTESPPAANLRPATVTPAQNIEPPVAPTTQLPASPTVTASHSPTPLPTPTPSETPPVPTASGDQAIHIYLVQTGTGGPVACGDSLIRINTGAARTGDVETDVAAALKRLFVKREMIAGLYNPAFRSNIRVQGVEYKAYTGLVSINLTGTYVRSGDRCDDRRVRDQVWTTVRQFPEVRQVYILLNGNLLGDILATGK